MSVILSLYPQYPPMLLCNRYSQNESHCADALVDCESEPFDLLAFLFDSQSLMAAFIPSSANMEQCNLTGGKFNSFAISLFVICAASSTCIPTIFSVAKEELAIADPHPNVLKQLSTILPFSSTLNWNLFIRYPIQFTMSNVINTTTMDNEQWALNNK